LSPVSQLWDSKYIFFLEDGSMSQKFFTALLCAAAMLAGSCHAFGDEHVLESDMREAQAAYLRIQGRYDKVNIPYQEAKIAVDECQDIHNMWLGHKQTLESNIDELVMIDLKDGNPSPEAQLFNARVAFDAARAKTPADIAATNAARVNYMKAVDKYLRDPSLAHASAKARWVRRELKILLDDDLNRGDYMTVDQLLDEKIAESKISLDKAKKMLESLATARAPIQIEFDDLKKRYHEELRTLSIYKLGDVAKEVRSLKQEVQELKEVTEDGFAAVEERLVNIEDVLGNKLTPIAAALASLKVSSEKEARARTEFLNSLTKHFSKKKDEVKAIQYMQSAQQNVQPYVDNNAQWYYQSVYDQRARCWMTRRFWRR
jgi:hypothetical protein